MHYPKQLQTTTLTTLAAMHFQVEMNRENQSLLLQQNSIVSNLANALPPYTNTVIPPALLETNAAEVQVHLEGFRLSITRSRDMVEKKA